MAQNESKKETPPWAAGTEGRMHELNPELNDEQISLVEEYGERKSFKQGDLLWDAGARDAGMFLVLQGEMSIFYIRDGEEHSLITHGRGHYGGETVTMTGAGALVGGRAVSDIDVIQVKPDELRHLIATETELGEIILLSFILRRMRMIAEDLANILLIGAMEEKRCAELANFMSRNGLPFESFPPDSEKAKALLDKHGKKPQDLPIVICKDEVLVKPCNRALGDCLAFTVPIEDNSEYDVVVLGAGPGGLAAAVYGASEGLEVLVIEKVAPGGQAGSSSKIENYLGFPTGISGQALTGRGYLQAQKFGAKIAVAREVKQLHSGDTFHSIELENGQTIKARAVVIATGAVYRQPDIPGLNEHGSIHYGASHLEGQACKNKNVAIIGGGNSAGQAAMYLSKRASEVHIVIRGASLASSMSEYLIKRIDKTPNIYLHANTEVDKILGDKMIEKLAVRNNQSGEAELMDVSELFIFIGARPGTDFIGDSLALDKKGFVFTDENIPNEVLHSSWKEKRKPWLYETSCPRIFAVGDVRANSVKRVASAVGEGSVCIQFIHRVVGEFKENEQ